MANRKRAARCGDQALGDIGHAPRERWSHGQDYDVIEISGPVAARRVQRATGAIESLRRSNRIGDAEVSAAGRWVGDFERSMRSSYVDPSTAGIRAPGGSNTGPELRWLAGLDAATRCAQVRQALGAHAEARLVCHVHYGRSLRARVQAETGGVGGSAMNRAATEFADILKTLVAHYVDADRQSCDGILRPRAEVAGEGMAA